MLSEYALLAGSERGIMVGPRGDFVGMCAPDAACGPPGLLTEEYDITQRQVRGNAPQAFVHALLLESAQRLAAPAATTDKRRYR